MTDLKPPFRADHVGSLLRPASIVEARKKFYQDKSIDAAELKAVEDAAIPELIKMQEDVGLKAVTDGEARRSFWHYDFMGMLTGLDLDERDEGVQFAGVKLRPIYPTITSKLLVIILLSTNLQHGYISRLQSVFLLSNSWNSKYYFPK